MQSSSCPCLLIQVHRNHYHHHQLLLSCLSLREENEQKRHLREAIHIKDSFETIRLSALGVKSAPYTNGEKFCKHCG